MRNVRVASRVVSTLLAGVALFLSLAAQAAAPGATPPAAPAGRGPGWAIILFSGKTREEAESRLAALRTPSSLSWVAPAPGFPRVAASDSLPGLAPGLHVVLLGLCPSKPAAEAARARVSFDVRDAFVKQVTGPVEQGCPTLHRASSTLRAGAEQLAALAFPGAPGFTLTVHEGNRRSRMECETSDLILQLRHGKAVLDEQVIAGECIGACTKEAKKAGREDLEAIQNAVERGEASTSQLDYDFTGCQSLTPRLEKSFVQLGNPVVALSLAQSAPHGGMSNDLQFVGVGCGKLVLSERFDRPDVNTYMRSQDLEDVEARPLKPGTPGWKAFSLVTAEGKVLDVEWVESACQWKLKP